MTRKEIIQLVELTVEKVLEKKNNVVNSTDEWIGTNEAAKIIGISPFRLRELKHHFECRKAGKSQSSRLLFRRATLMENYCNINPIL